MKKKILSLVLAAILTVGAVMPAYAAEKEVDVTIEVKATDVDVTVPTTLPVVFNADGTNTYPETFTITNNSEIARLELSTASVDAENNGWGLTTADAKTLAADTKDVKFYAGIKKDSVETFKGNFTALNTDLAFNEIIPAEGTLSMCFKMERAAFTQAIAVASAFDMVLDFNWAE